MIESRPTDEAMTARGGRLRLSVAVPCTRGEIGPQHMTSARVHSPQAVDLDPAPAITRSPARLDVSRACGSLRS
jgi:hypothetical protein